MRGGSQREPVAGLGRHHRCYRASWCRPTLPYRPFELLPSLFLLFLQEIISDRPRKPAETLARARFDDKKTAKKQRRPGKEQRKSVNARPGSPPAATSY
jgi:hypothetical protein